MDVTPGSSGFPGLSMTCTNCGAKARYSPSPPSDDTDVISVRLDASEATSVLTPLADARLDDPAVSGDGEDAPTVRTSGIDELLAERLGAPPPPQPILAPTPPFAAAPGAGRAGGRTAVPDPSLHFRPPEAGGHSGDHAPLMVARIRSAEEIAAAAPRDDNDTDRGFPRRDFKDEARAQREQLHGKAWSASVIRRRLEESGYEDSGAHESADSDVDPDDGAVTTLLEPLEEHAVRVHVELPKAARPDRQQVGGHITTDETITANALSEPAPHAVGTVTPKMVSAPSTRAPSRPQPAAHRQPSAEVMDSVLYQERARRRHLLVTVLLGAVLVAGAVFAYLRSTRTSDAPAPDAPPAAGVGEGEGDGPDEPDVSLAARRAAAYGLAPLVATIPFGVTTGTALSDYPDRLIVSVTLTNESERAVSVLQLSGMWHQVHETSVALAGRVTSTDREISATQPLAPGESTTRLVEFEGSVPLVGEPRESFVWLELVAGGAGDVIFSGPVAMVEVRTR
jgi:hypothetical protein